MDAARAELIGVFMEVIDLSQKINEGMPVYPGTEGPRLEEATTINKDCFAEKLITMYSHTGTHMDAPCHMINGAKRLDEFAVSKFAGKGIVVDVSQCGSSVGVDIVRFAIEIRIETEYVLLRTNWSNKWGEESYYKDFPVLTIEAARYLARANIKGIGVDCISVDPVGALEMANHHVLLNAEMVIIENLCNLDKLIDRSFMFCCFPLKIENADGSPIRAVGIVK